MCTHTFIVVVVNDVIRSVVAASVDGACHFIKIFVSFSLSSVTHVTAHMRTFDHNNHIVFSQTYTRREPGRKKLSERKGEKNDFKYNDKRKQQMMFR